MKKILFNVSPIVFFVLLFNFSPETVSAGSCVLPDFNAASFSDSLTIDNPYLPLVPGTTYVYEPVPNEDDVISVMVVTNSIKTVTVDGKSIDCREVHDYESEDGLLVEDTYDWYAQDDEGNVWYCGEDTEAYTYDDDGNLIETSTEGSWEAGVGGALPGFLIVAEPKTGDCYQQEYYEGEAEDMARVLRDNASVSIDLGDYDQCLKTKEWTPLDRGVVEHKYYAPGVGLVYIEELKEKTVRVELVDMY